MAKRLAKTIDPKLMSDTDEDPALQAAQQQMQAMGQEMEGMHQMLQNVGKSIEMQDLKRKDYEAEIKAYQAETQRISAVQAGMSPEQIQDIVLGTLHAAMDNGDIVAGGQGMMSRDNMEATEPQELAYEPTETPESMQVNPTAPQGIAPL
jgi:hypothetical protein